MQVVELKVNVDKSQLTDLERRIRRLQNTTIKLKTSADPTSGTRKGFKETGEAADKAGQSILSVMGKVAKWTAVTAAVYAPIKAFKEAVSTIKALDTEMVNVQKVTGASSRQMQQFQQQAYQLSMQYGRSVTDVASAMTSFARAGYGDKLDDMAELSTLVQNVGYVSEETADRMLLAVDAAWKLGGSQTELMKVIDGVDKVTNQNATDFQKMAEGMTVAASVFAESGESIQTFAAMVGTGTAATQRGGSEIARGLRTIMMNIRQIKGETEDGELIDGESIAKASAALKEFAGISTMENGELRKASDVLSDLAHKWDELDTVQQSAISEALAGKRQANILTALMGNWDMVEKQMQEYADAAGTAMKENEIYMDSWAAKTEQLKATWTDFVANFVTSDLATGVLDTAIAAVQFLDSGLGQATVTALAFAAAGKGIVSIFKAIAGSKAIGLITKFFQVASSGGIVAALAKVAAFMGPIGIAIAGIAATVGTMKLAEAFRVDYDEQVDKVKELQSAYEELYGAEGEYQELKQKEASDDGLADYEKRRLDFLEQEKSKMEENLEVQKELAKQKYQQEYGNQRHVNEPLEDRPTGTRKDQKIETQDIAMAKNLAKAFREVNSELASGKKSDSEYKQSIKDLMDQYSEFVDVTREGLEGGWLDYSDLTDAQKEILNLYEALERLYSMDGKELRIEAALDSFEQAGDGVAQFANQVVVDGAKMRQAFMDAGLSAEDANRTIQELRNGGAIVIDVENDGIDQTLGYLEELGVAKQDVEGNWNIDFGDVQNLAKELGMSAGEATTLAAELSKLNGVNVTGAVESTDRIATSVKELMNGAPYTFDMNAIDNASGTVEGVKTEIESTPETHDTSFNGEASGVTGAAGSAESAITSVDKTWNTRFTGSPQDVVTKSGTAKSAVGTVPRSWSTTFSGNTGPIAAAVSRAKALIASLGSGVGPGGGKAGSGNAGLHKATGDLHFRGGPVLLGDELSPDGSPRPELVITKNGAFIAGMAGPVMTSLPAGSRILKYSDTLDVLSGSDMTRLQAFPGGTGTGGLSLSEIRARGQSSGGSSSSAGSSASKPSTSTSSSGSSRSSGSSGSRSSGSSRSSGRSGGRSSGSSGSSGGGGSSVDTLKEELELLEAQYSYLEASNASTEELHNKSKEIQAKLHQINDTLRSTGGKEKDIVDNSTKWWQETEKQRQLLEEDVSLLEAQYDFMEESGASAEDLNAKSAEIQAKLHEINELARATGGNEKDILATSQKWWAELKKIHEVQRGVYQNERNLLQSEADLMEHQNKSAGERIAKLRQIQDSLHREAEYMRSIKASQAEINQLSIQWWEIESNIRAIQQDLVDQLNSAMSSAIDRASDRKDDAISELNDQIKELERERKARIESELGEKKAWIEVEEAAIKAIRREQEIAKENQAIADAEADIQEKKVKLLEAEKNLRNAMNERTIRYYNAKTGQWEWGADARNVKQAQEEYDRAKKDAEDAEANLPKLIEDTELSRRERILNETKDSVQDIEDKINDEFDALIDAVEDEIDALNTGFDDLESEWDDLYQKIFGTSTENIEKILQQMLEQGMITPEQAAEIRAFWNKINGFANSIDITTKEILGAVKLIQNEDGSLTLETQSGNMYIVPGQDVEKLQNGEADQITYRESNSDGSTSNYNIKIHDDKPVVTETTTTTATNENGGKTVTTTNGTTYAAVAAGTSSSPSGSSSGSSSGGSSTSSSSSSSSSSSGSSVEEIAKRNGVDLMVAQSMKDTNDKLGYEKYDSGGILSGFGGIKATARDEIVIPPSLAEYMLKPSANKTFQSRVSELAYLYGAKPIPSTLSNNRSSNDHYGDTYTFGNVTLTEDKAKNTTVYELAQMSRSLGIYRNG